MRTRPRRADLLRGFFESFAETGGAPYTMRHVASATMTKYGSIYNSFSCKDDLLRGVDQGLASWAAEHLRGVGRAADKTKALQVWFEGNEPFVLGMAMWISDRIRSSIRRSEAHVEEARGVLEDVCAAVAPALGVSVTRARRILLEVLALAIVRFLLGLGSPTIASRESAWRTILEGVDVEADPACDRYAIDEEAVELSQSIRSGRHPDD
jgi:hypothetical protein